jgi:hypothetical protein
MAMSSTMFPKYHADESIVAGAFMSSELTKVRQTFE